VQRRVVIGALLAAVVGFGVHPAAAAAQQSAMTFRIAALEQGRCGARCPMAIVAEGVIEEETPQAFLDFAKQAATAEPRLRGIVLLNSPGGRVVASMKLGAVFRKIHAAVVVARIAAIGDQAGPIAGQCMSACVYAMMGGVKRVVPHESRVGIHRMSTIEYGAANGRGPSVATRSYADDEMVGALARYAAKMGVNPAIIRDAETISPDEIHVLSPAELRRWRLASSQF